MNVENIIIADAVCQSHLICYLKIRSRLSDRQVGQRWIVDSPAEGKQ